MTPTVLTACLYKLLINQQTQVLCASDTLCVENDQLYSSLKILFNTHNTMLHVAAQKSEQL